MLIIILHKAGKTRGYKTVFCAKLFQLDLVPDQKGEKNIY